MVPPVWENVLLNVLVQALLHAVKLLLVVDLVSLERVPPLTSFFDA